MNKKGRAFFMCAHIRSLMLLALLVCRSASAILDGRLVPIVLENRYTFTNFEWAQGYVHFKQGFDLPTNGTIILKLEEDPAILADVNLRNGTLILYKGITFENSAGFLGDGFIVGNNAKITYRTTTRFDGGTYLGLSGNIKFRGSGFGFIDASSTVFDARKMNNLEFVQCTFNDRSKLLTSTTNPVRLVFKNSNIRSGATTWNNPEIFFEGRNSIGTLTTLTLNKVTILPYSSLTVSQQTFLSLSALDIQSSESALYLVSATLFFTGTSGSAIVPLGDSASSSQGRFIVKGPSTISLNKGRKLAVAPSLSLELSSRAKLFLNKGTISLQ